MANIRDMVFIRNPITYSPIDLSAIVDDSLEALGITLNLNNSCLTLIGAYRHPNVPTSAATISSITSFLNSHEPAILLGDMNAHHPMWGGTYTSPTGRLLAQDLAIASSHISPLCDTRILPDLLGSDYHPVEVSVNCLVRTSSVFSCKIKLTKEQWSEVESKLHNMANSISQTIKDINPNDPVSQYNTFMELISTSFEHFSPSKPPPSTKTVRASFTSKGLPPAPWWTPECSSAVKNRSDALKNFKSHPSWDNYVYYRSVVTQTRKTLRKAKRNNWRSFCNSLNERQNSYGGYLAHAQAFS
ncbi:PREDICTED: uncharacterized protein LOC108759487 [Trachymyrmex cornetzi]|uniref:uncharacterized protein LOC108759487 n=1 Tax=Trachymyrmex cornetzi TaxID=471704 RepID=UPI00084F41EF|nr:PREDICTED: uncharacterized protein LOC108759487 [Trachymyrmex cornetzi]